MTTDKTRPSVQKAIDYSFYLYLFTLWLLNS